MPTKMSDPLLCLTVSTTLREKPVTVTPARQPLAALIKAAKESDSLEGPTTPTAKSPENEDKLDVNGLEEINLLEGLSLGEQHSRKDSDI